MFYKAVKIVSLTVHIKRQQGRPVRDCHIDACHVPISVRLHVLNKEGKVFRLWLERIYLTRHTDPFGREQRVVTHMSSDIEDRHSLTDQAIHQRTRLGLIPFVNETVEESQT